MFQLIELIVSAVLMTWAAVFLLVIGAAVSAYALNTIVKNARMCIAIGDILNAEDIKGNKMSKMYIRNTKELNAWSSYYWSSADNLDQDGMILVKLGMITRHLLHLDINHHPEKQIILDRMASKDLTEPELLQLANKMINNYQYKRIDQFANGIVGPKKPK